MATIIRFMRVLLAAAVLVAPAVTGSATRTATFTVQATMVSDCLIVSAPTLDFGTIGVLTVYYDSTSTLVVNCTPQTEYSIALDAGSGTGSTVEDRRMVNGSNSIQYGLFRDAGRTQIWGNTVGTDTFGGTGTGANQNITIYGRIPAGQPTQPAGVYTSTVTVTLSF